jgi:hypothetical protein
MARRVNTLKAMLRLVVLVNQSLRDGPAAGRSRRPGQHQDWSVVDNPRRAKRRTSLRSLVVVVPDVPVENPLKMTSAPRRVRPDRAATSGVGSASGGGKVKGSHALPGGVTKAVQRPFPQVNGGVAGTGFEPV